MSDLNKWLISKRNDDSIGTQILRLLFSLGQKSWLHAAISALLGIFIPICYEKEKWWLFFFGIFLLLLDIWFAYICNSYQIASYTQRKFASEILSDQSALLKSIVIEMENNSNWKNKIFKTVSAFT